MNVLVWRLLTFSRWVDVVGAIGVPSTVRRKFSLPTYAYITAYIIAFFAATSRVKFTYFLPVCARSAFGIQVYCRGGQRIM